ncbi:MAG: murein biosynthesis integral membrane protein MurJ [Nocardioides sp.]
MSGDTAPTDQQSVLTSSAVMAAGTVVSRMSGYVRTMLLVLALGSVLHADVFTLSNTVPNMLYILLAGGIFNAVLVPQLVRSMKHDEDGGEAYANRVVTLAALFLGVVTVLLVLAAPLVMDVFLKSEWDAPALASQRESIVDFARYCLPQVFFYGMFVLVGQILNARGRFGPMMWAPIANNVIAVLVLVAYLVVFGKATTAEQYAGYSAGQELLLGLGSTAGIAVQFLILLPYLRAAGFTWRPRFDFRDAGLGHTLRLGFWTVAFVVVNQIAYTVVVNLASGGTAQSQLAGASGPPQDLADQGTGYTIYTNSFLIMMVPHAIVTVSLATAILPRLAARAAEADLPGLARGLAETLRTALAVVIPFAALVPVVSLDLAHAFFGLGAGRDTFPLYQDVLTVFGPGLVVFTVHYLMLRGFYALERTRTVFLVQCGIAAVNIVAALLLVRATDARGTAPALAGAYLAAYAVGSLASYLVLRRLVGGLETPVLVRFLVRMVIAVGASTAVAWLVSIGMHALVDGPRSFPVAVLSLVAVTAADAAVFLVAARLLRIREVGDVVDTVLGRVRRRTPAH